MARAAPLGPPTDAQRELITAHIVDPTILEERELFAWSATVSNSNLDAYYTRMHESSLRNFAEDAKAGLSFMNSHRTGGWIGQAELPLGHSFDARYVGPSSAGPARVEESFYTFRGLDLTGLSTDQFIDGLRSGIARDISIGFIPGEYRCSIDGLNWNSYECRHWPGRKYPKVDSKGNAIEGEDQLAFLWVHDAHQTEASSVYDGATPGCMVTKAKRMAAAGEIRIETINWLEQRYRINLPHPARSFGGADVPSPKQEERMDPIELTTEQVSQIRLALVGAGRKPDEDLVASIVGVAEEARTGRASAAEVERLKPFETEVATLRPLADQGRQYRADLVENAITEGKRARGDAFDEPTYRSLLEAAPLETVKRMHDDWKADGDAKFPGGRRTQDTAETGLSKNHTAAPPSAAFAG